VTAYSGELKDESLDGQRVVVGGVVTASRTVVTKARSTWPWSPSRTPGRDRLVVFPRLFEQTAHWHDGAIVLVAGRIDHRGEEVSLLADLVRDFDAAAIGGEEAFAAEVAAADRGRGRGRPAGNGSGNGNGNGHGPGPTPRRPGPAAGPPARVSSPLREGAPSAAGRAAPIASAGPHLAAPSRDRLRSRRTLAAARPRGARRSDEAAAALQVATVRLSPSRPAGRPRPLAADPADDSRPMASCATSSAAAGGHRVTIHQPQARGARPPDGARERRAHAS